MKVVKTNLDDCYIIEPVIHGDERGFFIETFQALRYKQLLNIDKSFVQDNHSRSKYGILRGLHFQKNYPQGKLVRVVRGEVFDVAVDLRKDSSTFGDWFGVYLSEENKKQLWVPPGFAHGFLVTSKIADFEYKCTELYYPDDEVCLKWNDEEIGIKWPIEKPILSNKDSKGMFLRDLF